jgi:lipid II isoglutaminyl synthase (glutamine-hydrolysing)
LRFKYGGVPPENIEVVTHLEHALDRGLELTSSGGELVVLPTYTAMLALRRIAVARGLVRPYWEEAA